jgi:hypothetical protein
MGRRMRTANSGVEVGGRARIVDAGIFSRSATTMGARGGGEYRKGDDDDRGACHDEPPATDSWPGEREGLSLDRPQDLCRARAIFVVGPDVERRRAPCVENSFSQKRQHNVVVA